MRLEKNYTGDANCQLIHHQYLTYTLLIDGSLIHCRHPTNAITMTIHRSVDQHLNDPQLTVKCHLADELTNS